MRAAAAGESARASRTRKYSPRYVTTSVSSPMRRSRFLATGSAAQRGGDQPQRRGGTEDDGLRSPGPGELDGAAGDGRAADHQRRGVPDHLERLGRVELPRAVPARGVDGQLAGIEPQ